MLTKRRTLSILIFILLEGLINLSWFNRSSSLPFLALGAFLFLCAVLIITNRRSFSGQIAITPLLILFTVYTLYRFLSTAFTPLPLHALEVVSLDLFQLAMFVTLLVTYSTYWKQSEFETSILLLAVIFTTVNLIILGIRFTQIANVPDLPLLTTFIAYRLPGGLLIHPNFEAAFLNLVIPFALVRWHRSGHHGTKVLWIALIFIFLVVEYFCSSRGAWLSLLCSGFLTLTLLWLSRFETVGTGIKVFLKMVTPKSMVIAMVILAIAALGFNQLLSFEVEQRSHYPIATARTSIWKIGFDVIGESPILGSGPGSFHYLSAWFSKMPPGFFLSHAHNMWIEIFAESGVPGLLLALGIAVVILRSMIRIWDSKDNAMRTALIPIAGAITGLFLQNLVDFSFDAPLITFVFICFLVILDRTEPNGHGTNLRLTTIGVLLLAGSSLYLLLGWWNHRGSTLMREGVADAREGYWTQAANHICKAEQEAPGYTFYGFQCGLALATAADRNDDTSLLDHAIEVYRHSLEADPYWPVHWANLATLEFNEGEIDRAITDLSTASQQANRNTIFLVYLGWIYEQTGQSPLAEVAYREALDLDPWLARSSFMHNSTLRRMLAESIEVTIFENPSEQPSLPGWIRLDHREYEKAALQFESNLEQDAADALSHAGLALALALQNGPSERATRHLELAQFYAKESIVVQDAVGLMALIRGDNAQASDYFLSVFEALRNRNDSVSFYASTYPRPFLPGDAVPQLISMPVSSEVYQHLYWLAIELERSGDFDKSAEIQDWVASQLEY